eukprot:1161165-Pelagomonas_calceolata.AAC.5
MGTSHFSLAYKGCSSKARHTTGQLSVHIAKSGLRCAAMQTSPDTVANLRYGTAKRSRRNQTSLCKKKQPPPPV